VQFLAFSIGGREVSKMMPERLSFLVKYLKENYLAPSERIAPPLILKGETGVGKSWVLNRLYSEFGSNIADIPIRPVLVPFQLTASNLVTNISIAVEKEKRDALLDQKTGSFITGRTKFLLLMEGIDRLYNVPFGQEQGPPKKAIGAGASHLMQLQQARELRGYLIENSNNLSFIATSGPDLRFTEDADLPFFNFFNVIEVKPLSSQESLDYITMRVKECRPDLELLDIVIKLYGSLVVDIADGSIVLLNMFVGALSEASRQNKVGLSQNHRSNHFLTIYFGKLTPYVELIIQNLSYVERLLVDELIRLSANFSSRDIGRLDINLSRVLAKLESKGVIESVGETRKTSYRFRKESFRSWLRFHKRLELRYE
jgi:hypothetical protein